jgi:hypothetical protein
MSCLTNEEKKCLFERIRHLLGAPLVKIEIADEQWCSILEIAIEDYAQYVQDWLIEHQWSSVLGQNISTTDIAFALTTRSLDFETQYTYAYSKQVGLQARGPWELKKDFIQIEKGKQIYQIPAGREINEVLWLTPPSIDHALWSQYGLGNNAFGTHAQFPSGGFGVGAGGGNGGYGGAYYISPAFDILLTASDYNLKNRMIRSELVYKITAGPNGTRLIHLFSTPGSDISFGGSFGTGRGIVECKVWYHYYDTGEMTEDEAEQCKEENKDIIKLPNDVPLEKIDFCDLNEPTKVWVRKYMTAKAKEVLGRVRGKFSGQLPAPNAPGTLDYNSLLEEAKSEVDKLVQELSERLERLRSDKQLERKANEAENLNKSLGFRPLGFWVY